MLEHELDRARAQLFRAGAQTSSCQSTKFVLEQKKGAFQQPRDSTPAISKASGQASFRATIQVCTKNMLSTENKVVIIIVIKLNLLESEMANAGRF